MKLNKLQRHTAYIIMLAEFENHAKNNIWELEGSWFCYLVWDLFRMDNKGFNYRNNYGSIDNVLYHFDELYEKMDGNYVGHNDFATRRKILQQCIKQTA